MQFIIRIVRQWAELEEGALRRMLSGKSAEKRLGGLGQTRHYEGMALFTALLPCLIAGPIFAPWSEASVFGKIVMGATAVWAFCVFAISFIIICKAIVRINAEKKD